MERITPGQALPLFDIATTRQLEREAAQALPPHTLMQRAGRAVARLSQALAPHARCVWVACGPGNNGGDGLEAAMHLQRQGRRVLVTWSGDEARAPADALASLQRARDAGVQFAAEPPREFEFAIDALLGIGGRRPLQGPAAEWQHRLSSGGAPVLAVDVPSGLDPDTGAGPGVRAACTLSLLTLKPGLFTAAGRDLAGEVWFDDLGVNTGLHPSAAPCAQLLAARPPARRPHASHKGSWGDVAVVGGAPGMSGAALLAASAALHGGAGRVFVALLDAAGARLDTGQPELMLRTVDSLDFSAMHLACGCGGGDAVRAVLPRALSTARSLVLDADALNAVAADTALQSLLKARAAVRKPTVITPHPLEAARLLGTGAAQVQSDRLAAARTLVSRLGCVVVLKGSGTVLAAPGHVPRINLTGNALLATAGTGDVLAGLVAARLAGGAEAMEAAAWAVHAHGAVADAWPAGQALVASRLARRLSA